VAYHILAIQFLCKPFQMGIFLYRCATVDKITTDPYGTLRIHSVGAGLFVMIYLSCCNLFIFSSLYLVL